MTFNPGVLPFRIRFSIQNLLADIYSGPYELYVSKNGGAYTQVTASGTQGVLTSTAASSDADETPIYVPRLTPPAS
jgi:hypothetical protein